MKKLTLLFSLLAVGALGLTACEGDDDESTPDATEARLSPEQKIEQTGNNFAVAFAAGSRFARMTQPFLERITCKRIGGQIENCTPPSSRFRKSFAGATVEDIAIKGNRATAKFSNREVVELDHVSGYELGGIWLIHKFGGNAGAAASATDPASKSCGTFDRWKLAVVEGDTSCRVTRRVMHDWVHDRLPICCYWICNGPDGDLACTKNPEASSRIVITARLASEAAAVEADPGNNSQLSNAERIEQAGNEWAALFAADRNTCRHMGQPACERMGCERVAYDPIKNCTPPSAEFRESFADATVERVVVDGHHATAEFSNGELVEFEGQKADAGDKAVEGSAWFIPEEWIKKVARRNFEP